MDSETINIDDPIFRDLILVSKINTLQNYLGNKKVMYDILSNDNKSFDFLPLTATFNVTESNYRKVIKHAMEYSDKIKTWILKPAVGLQGNDILVSDDVRKIVDFVESHGFYTDWVLSQYIDNPFLLKLNGKSESGAVFNDSLGRKTHIRIYVLITKINGNSNIYLYENNLIFSAVKEYSGNIDDKYSNLTNLHLGSIYYNEVLKLDGTQAYKDLSFPLKETVNKLFGQKFYSRMVFPQIKKMLEIILDNSVDYLKCEKVNPDSKGCFQYIAIDIMPDIYWKLYLLEINGSPGMNAPMYHWKNLNKFAKSLVNKTSDLLKNNTKKIVKGGFILIK